MNVDRRTTILALLSGALAGIAIIAARRGVPGAGKIAGRLTRPIQPKAQAKTHGYREIDLS